MLSALDVNGKVIATIDCRQCERLATVDTAGTKPPEGRRAEREAAQLVGLPGLGLLAAHKVLVPAARVAGSSRLGWPEV
jgi:hypothetical protein